MRRSPEDQAAIAARAGGGMRVVGFGPGGKPRLRGTGWEPDLPYRNLDMPGQAGFGITLPLTSGKSEARYRDRAVKAARDLDRNNEIIRGGLDRKANTVVGATLRVNPMPNFRALGQPVKWAMEFGQQCADVFADWATDNRCLCDSEGHYQFGGLMWQAFRSLVGPDAEIAGVIHYEEERREEYQTKWATHVQLVDPDRISNPDGKPDSNILFKGRQLDKHGRMVGLHIRRTHPSEATASLADQGHEYVERETYWGRPHAFHWFVKRRSGMQRALTNLVTSFRHVRMLDTFDDKILQNASTSALLAAFVKTTMKPEEVAAHLAPATDEEGDTYSEFDLKLDHYEEMELRVGDQRVPVLGPNDEIAMARMANALPPVDEFRNTFLRAFASALGVSFEQLSLDFSKSNYSSTRASILEAWKQVVVERTLFTAHVANLVYDAVIEEAFALGLLQVPAGAPDFYEARGAYTACTWTGPGMGWVDPLKEANAAKVRKDTRISTLDRESASQGGNWRDDIDQIAVEMAYCEERGVPYDGPQPPAAAGEGDDDEEEDNDKSDARQKKETVE